MTSYQFKKKQDRIVVRLALKYPCWTVRWVLFACVFLFSLEKKKPKLLKSTVAYYTRR